MTCSLEAMKTVNWINQYYLCVMKASSYTRLVVIEASGWETGEGEPSLPPDGTGGSKQWLRTKVTALGDEGNAWTFLKSSEDGKEQGSLEWRERQVQWEGYSGMEGLLSCQNEQTDTLKWKQTSWTPAKVTWCKKITWSDLFNLVVCQAAPSLTTFSAEEEHNPAPCYLYSDLE